jgi:aerobic-type carbon monoxide dehydrogenase small subunit (CoxS/CutS family)
VAWRSAALAQCTWAGRRPGACITQSIAHWERGGYGIEETAAGQKIQKAWLDLEVVRCGYCQSGQKGRLTMSLDHLASRVAGPSLSRRSFL